MSGINHPEMVGLLWYILGINYHIKWSLVPLLPFSQLAVCVWVWDSTERREAFDGPVWATAMAFSCPKFDEMLKISEFNKATTLW
jgi:hypothetical protein